MSTDLTAPAPQPENAYSLLSRPILELTDAEVDIILVDLRKKRASYLQGIADKPASKAKPAAAPKLTDEAKKANTANLLGQLANFKLQQ